MKLKISNEDVWVTGMKDRPGSLAAKLADLARAGANLEFVIARRESSIPGTGVVFVTPLKGAKQIKAAKEAGFAKSKSLHSLRITCANKKGLGAALTRALAKEGVNLRGFSGAALAKQCVFHLAFDKAADARKAVAILKKMA
ncbi:MAG: amino acid-binding protein [Phycisphaerae bacterium]|nr:amino acid-binding protein [Phycisphaerae bacterium]